MKRGMYLLAMFPGLAMAHPGHGGLGHFHHAWDVLLMMVVVGVIGAGLAWHKRR
ncbi:hypothetical protein [Ferrimonas marina]|uniref:Uncharacterized protein n=1 Tax=Ferrimonas marina TaxID=299255 RepID=A0A1M5VGC1_9GAMM|nr:hypothetical protein [Ferrimonas marina]SHH74299.1 hypothetical protein SAMN02745129_2766 [Ferrimonas marina]